MIKGYINQVKWAYQRVVRGYDDRIFWGFDDHFAVTFIPPLKVFCAMNLAVMNKHLNQKRWIALDNMISAILAYERESYEDKYNGVGLQRILDLFARDHRHFWD